MRVFLLLLLGVTSVIGMDVKVSLYSDTSCTTLVAGWYVPIGTAVDQIAAMNLVSTAYYSQYSGFYFPTPSTSYACASDPIELGYLASEETAYPLTPAPQITQGLCTVDDNFQYQFMSIPMGSSSPAIPYAFKFEICDCVNVICPRSPTSSSPAFHPLPSLKRVMPSLSP